MPKWRPEPKLVTRLVAEFAIIVFGVLVALQLEGWRDALRDREKEGEQLEALRADFEANARGLDETIALQRRSVEAHEELLHRFGPDIDPISPDSLATIYGYGTTWYAFEPVTGAYDALLNSGDIGLIRDRSLRRDLAQFYGIVEAGFEDHDDEMNLLALLLNESRGQARRLIAPNGRVKSYRPFLPDGAEEAAAAELLSNEEFAGLLVWKTYRATGRMAWLEDLRSRTDAVLSKLGDVPAR